MPRLLDCGAYSKYYFKERLNVVCSVARTKQCFAVMATTPTGHTFKWVLQYFTWVLILLMAYILWQYIQHGIEVQWTTKNRAGFGSLRSYQQQYLILCRLACVSSTDPVLVSLSDNGSMYFLHLFNKAGLE